MVSRFRFISHWRGYHLAITVQEANPNRDPGNDKHNNDFVLVTVAFLYTHFVVLLCVGSSSHPGRESVMSLQSRRRGLFLLSSLALLNYVVLRCLLCSAINHSSDIQLCGGAALLVVGSGRTRIDTELAINSICHNISCVSVILLWSLSGININYICSRWSRTRKNLLTLLCSLSWRHGVCMFPDTNTTSSPVRRPLESATAAEQVGRDDLRLPEDRGSNTEYSTRVNYGLWLAGEQNDIVLPAIPWIVSWVLTIQWSELAAISTPCRRTNGSNVECNQYLYECNGSGLKSEWMVQ